MTTKLTLELSQDKTAVVYVNDTARVLVGNQIKVLNEIDSISVLDHVDLTIDNSLRVLTNTIVPVKSVEKVEGVIVGYIDPEKTRKIASQVIGVYIPKLAFSTKKEEQGYSMYFAAITECDVTI